LTPPSASSSAPSFLPKRMSAAQADAIPRGKVSYGSSGAAFDRNRGEGPARGDVFGPNAPSGQAAVVRHALAPNARASGAACTLEANDPFLIAPVGRKAVEASGFQACVSGVGQRTQACLYKQHRFLGVRYFKRTYCRREVYDRRPTLRPVAAIRPCSSGGTGRWRTVIFGSIFYKGPRGPGRYAGAVRSGNDKSFSRCN